MVKVNTVIFLGCVASLFLFLWCIWQTFTKELALLNQTNNHLSKVLLFHNSNEFENTVQPDKVQDELSSENVETINYLPCHSFGSMRWFHDTQNGECYEVGQIGPCGDAMTFYPHPRKNLAIFGFCDCDAVDDHPRCEGVERPLIYYPLKDRCYTVFSQGPCQMGEWLILDKSLKPICETNPCAHKPKVEDEFSLDFWIVHEKKCFKTMTRGFCEKGHILKTTKNSWKPECQKDTLGKCPQSSSVSVPALQCREGNRISQLGLCHLLQ